MSVRILPDFLINQIAAGEVVERPASVVKELVENALDAGADEIVIDVVDGGRTLISVIDNGSGMSEDDLKKSIQRHATSKLPSDDLLNINYMGFRGEALPSIASVSDMKIDTCNGMDANGWTLDCNTGNIKPSDWESGTRIRVENLFARTPARLKFLRGDRAELMSVVEVVKRLAMARHDVGFTLNNKWRFPKNQDFQERIVAVMGEDVRGRMLEVNAKSLSNSSLVLSGFVSEPTLRRASSVDQYLFVNNRPVKDKVLVGALRAAYMDVMHAREFPLCALYLNMDSRHVDVNVSPAKTEVHFLEPSHIRGFIIKNLRDVLSKTLNDKSDNKTVFDFVSASVPTVAQKPMFSLQNDLFRVNSPKSNVEVDKSKTYEPILEKTFVSEPTVEEPEVPDCPLGRAIGQVQNKYIIAEIENALVIVDQHAAHERITYEKIRKHDIKTQPLLTPIVISMKPEDVEAILTVQDELKLSGLVVDSFGDDAVAVFEKPADWDLNWKQVLQEMADEIREYGHSSVLNEKLHLKLANYACHHSVRAGQKLDLNQMNTLLRDIENTERGGECNHGRPVYKIIPFSEVDSWFERI